MYRLASLAAIVAAAAIGLAVYAQQPADPGDDPPVLKKKGAPDIQDPPAEGNPKDKDKDKDKKPADAPKPDADKGAEPDKPRVDPDEVLKGVTKSMKASEEHLANKELGESTRQAQDDALKGLDSLIDLTENAPDDQGGQENQANQSNQDKDSQDKKDGKSNSSKPSPGMSNSKSGQSGSKSSSSPGRNGKHRPGSRQGQKGNQPGQSGSQPGNGGDKSNQQQPGQPGGMQPSHSSDGKSPMGGAGGDSKNTDAAKDPNADLYKNVWGHLPETLRAEMNAYSNMKGFMPEYETLISRYYSTIAEQGRRKGD